MNQTILSPIDKTQEAVYGEHVHRRLVYRILAAPWQISYSVTNVVLSMIHSAAFIR